MGARVRVRQDWAGLCSVWLGLGAKRAGAPAMSPPRPMPTPVSHLQVHVQAGAPGGHPARRAQQGRHPGRVLAVAAIRVQEGREIPLQGEAGFGVDVHCARAVVVFNGDSWEERGGCVVVGCVRRGEGRQGTEVLCACVCSLSSDSGSGSVCVCGGSCVVKGETDGRKK